MNLTLDWKSNIITPITVILDSNYYSYDFEFTMNSITYPLPTTLNLNHGSNHDLIFNGPSFYGYETQSDRAYIPYHYLGRFEKWVKNSTVFDSSAISLRVPATTDTIICHLKDIQAGPEIRLRHGEFFDFHGEKKPVLIKE